MAQEADDVQDECKREKAVDAMQDEVHVDGAAAGSCCGCCGALADRCRERVADVREFGGEFGDEIVELCRKVNLRQRVRSMLTVEKLKNKFPITKWLPKYRLEYLQGDLVAGLTVGLTVIPQGIAYAQVAGLTSQHGLYSAFVGSFVYALLGTAKDITLGPTAIMSLIVASFAHSPITGDPTFAVLASLISGVIQLIMGIFCVGFLIEYISHPVINSFTTASAITIVEGQLKKWFGLKKIPQGFLHEMPTTLRKIRETRLWDFLLGAACLIMLHLLKKVKDVKIKNSKSSRLKRGIEYTIWLVGTARNAVVVLLAGTASAVCMAHHLRPFSASNNMPAGMPSFEPPKLSVYWPQQNRTLGTTEIFSTLGAGLGVIPLLGVLESIAIGKAFAKRNGYRIDADQELISLGVANILGSFVSAYPVTGSFSRTAVNSHSGVKTPLGGVFTGLLVIFSLLLLTPYFNYIPDAALAAVIIAAAFDLIDFSLLPKLWRVKKVELFPWLLTFILCLLLGVEYGILTGVGVSLLMLLYPWSRPILKVVNKSSMMDTEGLQPEAVDRRVVVFSIDQGVLFPGIEHLKDKVAQKGDGIVSCIVLDFSHVTNIDFTTLEGFSHMLSEYAKAGSTLVVSNPQPHVLEVFEKAKLKNFHHSPSVDEAIRLIKDIEEAKLAAKAAAVLAELTDGGLLERDDIGAAAVDVNNNNRRSGGNNGGDKELQQDDDDNDSNRSSPV